MEEEKMLKQKYNDLLDSLYKGTEYLKEHGDDEKAQKRLDEIATEMQNIMNAIPNMTDEEREKGFKIEEASEQVSAQVSAQVNEQASVAIPNNRIVKKENVLDNFKSDWEIASQLAKSSIIPDNYKGKPENVIIAVGLAKQMNLPPFTVMQNLAIIKGKTSWSGSFCKTLIERTGRFKDLELNYVGEKGKDSYGCYLSATRISDGKVINGPEVTMKMAKEEGWTSNKKWFTLTDLMLAYRCQSFFCRIYCPEAMNGIYTSEEIEDVYGNSQYREEPKDVL